MRTIFEAISSNSSGSGTLSDEHMILEHVVSASDFSSRLGKRSYLNWLETSCTHGRFNDYISKQGRRLVTDLVCKLELRSNLLDLCNDCVVRDRNILFVRETLVSLMQEAIPNGFAGDYEPDFAGRIISSAERMLVKPGELSRADNVDLVGCLYFKASMLVAYGKDASAAALLGKLTKSIPSDYLSRALSPLGSSVVSVLRALLAPLSLKLPSVATTPSAAILSRLVPMQVLARFGLSSPGGSPSGPPATPLDLMVIAQLVLAHSNFDFSLVLKVVKSAAEVCKSPTDWMFVHLGFTGPLLFKDQAMIPYTVSALVRGLADRGTKNFFTTALEYMIVQLRHGLPAATAGYVKERVKEAVEASSRRQDVLPDLLKVAVIQKLFQFDDDNDGKTFIYKLKKQRTASPVSERLTQTSSETQLQKLVNVLKRQT